MGPRTAKLLCGLWCLLLAAAAFYPFRPGWNGPRQVANGLERASDGAATFTGPSVLRTPAPPTWLASALEARALSVHVTASSARPDQLGPARVVTLSSGAYERNFMFAQKGADLIVRVRRPGADDNGAPPLKVDKVFAGQEPQSIELLVTDARVEVHVDGKRRAFEDCRTSPFDLWDPGHRLAFGDEVDGARGWEGTVHDATVAVQGEVYDLLADPSLEAPEAFWEVPEATRAFLRFDRSWAAPIALAHALAFVPFGVLLVLGAGGRRRFVAVVLLAATFGVYVQLGKLGFVGRHPSIFHVGANVLGALIGAALAGRRFPR